MSALDVCVDIVLTEHPTDRNGIDAKAELASLRAELEYANKARSELRSLLRYGTFDPPAASPQPAVSELDVELGLPAGSVAKFVKDNPPREPHGHGM